MIRIKSHKQMELFDSWGFLSPKRRQILDQGWPGLFKEHLLEQLPVGRLARFFNQRLGRPSKELYTVLGALLLQQTMDLTDQETVEQLAFNIQWHYALNITAESDEAKYVSAKTLWSMRQVVIENKLDQTMFQALTDKLAKVFAVNTDRQRIDSVHIASNMRKLGRIGIFVQTIAKFLVNLKRQQDQLFQGIDASIVDRYTVKKQLAAFSMVKPSESQKSLQQVSQDLYDLIERFKADASVCQMHSYKLMQRVLSEQCEVVENTVGVNPAAKVSGSSLQSPCDPEATYCGHKGQGYKAQIMETFSVDDAPDDKQKPLNLISHVQVQTACRHDSTALAPAIEQSKARNLCPATLLADTLYGSDDNVLCAQAANVDLVAPVMKGGKQTDTIPLCAFSFDAAGNIVLCPGGHAPESVKQKKGRFCACFQLSHCQGCCHLSNCPVTLGKKGYYLRYDAKAHRVALRRLAEQTDTFIDTYRWRAGIEATMSQLDRLTGIKHLRVRGLGAVRYCVTLKAAGLNLLRAAAVRAARKRAAKESLRRFFMPFPFFKERFGCFLARFGTILLHNGRADDTCFKTAA